MKLEIRDYIRGFMHLEFGKEGLLMRFSKFGLILLFLVIIFSGYFSYHLILNEVSQRNIEIERHRKTIKSLENEIIEKMQQIEKKEKEIQDLNEYKDIMKAIKDLSNNFLNKNKQKELAKVIYTESKKYRYDWRLIMAVIMTESMFKYDIESNDPSYGLMQIKLGTAKATGKKVGIDLNRKEQLFNISTNVKIGSTYLLEQILRFKDVKKGVVAYNLGPTKTSRITRRKKDGQISTDYLIKITKRFNFLKNNYNSNKNRKIS